MVGRQIARHQSDETVAIPPCLLENLISRSVEIEAVDVGGLDDVALGSDGELGRKELASGCFASRTRAVKWVVGWGSA